MRFLCDHMLGTLAKWLRFLGYDTAYPGPLDDTALLELARTEDRLLLTRDKELAGRAEGTFLIVSDVLDEQLAAVVTAFGLDSDGALTLCSVCNLPIETVSLEDVAAEVPPAVGETHAEFWRCPDCRRVYWKGSHYDGIVEKVRRLSG